MLYIYIYICHIFPKQCLHNGIECGSYVKGKGIGCGPQRRTRRWGGAFVSTLPLWFRANSVAFRRSRGGFARIPASSGLFWWGHLSCGPQRRKGGAFVSTLPLWFRANSVAFRRSRCGFARIPASSGLWPLLGGGAARRSRCGFARIPLRFDAPAVVSREFRPLLASGLFLGGGGGALRLRAARRSRCGFARIPLRFDAPAVVSREFRPLLASSEKAT